MTDKTEPHAGLPGNADAAAILRRRDFLVKSALAAAGASLAASELGCCLSPPKSDQFDETIQSEVCLTVDVTPDLTTQPEVCLSRRPPDIEDGDGDGTAEPQPEVSDAAEPQPEVIDAAEPQPEVIDAAQDTAMSDPGPDPAPQICLSPPLPDADAGPQPEVCLSPPLPDTGADTEAG